MPRAASLLWPAIVALTGGLLLVAVEMPRVGLILIVGTVAVIVGARAPAVPLAFAVGSTLASIVIAGQLPKGGTVALYTAWIFAALAASLLLRGGREGLLRNVVDPPFVATALLAVMILVHIAPWPADIYGSQKAQLVLVQLLLPYVAMSVVATREAELVRFFRVLLALNLAAACYATFQLATGGLDVYAASRLTLANDVNPIGLARDMGSTVLLLLFFVTRASSSRRRLLLTVAAAPALATMLASGSRGPVIALFVAVPVLLASRSGNRLAARRMVRALAVVAGFAVFAAILFVPSSAITRILSAFGGDTLQTGSDPHRSVLWNEALAAAPDHLVVGTGTGGFAGIDQLGLLYPHNIFLETLLEQGVVGLLLLVIVVVAAGSRIARHAASGEPGGEWAGLCLSLLAFGLVNAFFSGDISTNSTIWIWIGAGSGLIAAARQRRASRPLIEPPSLRPAL